MALIYEIMTGCHIYNKTRTDDPYGSYKTTYQKGASFEAAIVKNNSTEAIVAEKQGISEIYSVVTRQGFELDYHDVFQRDSDGMFFVVTSRSKDTEPPARSTIKIAMVTAEPWKAPSGVEIDEGNSGET